MVLLSRRFLLIIIIIISISFLVGSSPIVSSALECKFSAVGETCGELGAHCGNEGEPACCAGSKCWYSMCLAVPGSFCSSRDDCNGPCSDSVVTCETGECCGRHGLPCKSNDDCCYEFYCSSSSKKCTKKGPVATQCVCDVKYDFYDTLNGIQPQEAGACTTPSCGTAANCEVKCGTNLACFDDRPDCTVDSYLMWPPSEPHKQLCYTFTSGATQQMICDIQAQTSCFGLNSGQQTNEKVEVIVNGNSIGKTLDPYCNAQAPPQCRNSGPYASSFNDVIIPVQAGTNSLTLKAVQDSVNIYYFHMSCEPYEFCGDGSVNPGEECEPPYPELGYADNPYCEQSTETCLGKKTGTRDGFGDCDSICDCNYDNFKYMCVKGKCSAECAVDVDCDDQDPHTADTCNTNTCVCEHEQLPYCGDGNIDPGEECDSDAPRPCTDPLGYNGFEYCLEDCTWSECRPDEFCGDGVINDQEDCELPGTDDNTYCSQCPIDGCKGYKLGTRDEYGYCTNVCSCLPDPFNYECVEGECGAECDEDSDCPPKCVDEIYYHGGECDLEGDCDCSWKSEDCNSKDGWYDMGTTRWVETDQCNEKEQKKQKYKDFFCTLQGCDYEVTSYRWVDTGNTRYKPDGTSCNDGLWCSEPDVCVQGECGGPTRDCSHNDFGPLEGCDYIPDDYHYTWDYAPGFTSLCDEVNDLCTVGTRTWTHVCADDDMFDTVPFGSGCDAECDEDVDCDPSECSETYYDYCSAKKLVEYDDDKILDSTLVEDYEPNYCNFNTCFCTDNPVDCSPPQTNTYCVPDVCGAECAVDGDCDDQNPNTNDWCDTEACECKHEELPFCGNEVIDPGEDCELPQTDDNPYCDQSLTGDCVGNKLEERDDGFGYCDFGCGCLYDPFELMCVPGECGATCDDNSDCDDENIHTTDTCNLNTCQCENDPIPYCGDGIIQQGEECESVGPYAGWGPWGHQYTCNNDNTYNECINCQYEHVDECEYYCSGDYECDGIPPMTYLETCDFGFDYLQDFCNEICELEDNNCEDDYQGCTSEPECDELVPGTGDCNYMCQYKPLPECGNEVVEPGEECELPNTFDNSFCEQSTIDACEGKKTGVRDAYGDCDSSCGCVDDPFEYVCIEDSCGAQCDEDSDCNDYNSNTVDTCNLDSCMCEYEEQPFCGNEGIDPGEECELPNTFDNSYCEQSTIDGCSGAKLGMRDGFGDCDSICGCVDDPFEFMCVPGQCGAVCNDDADCDDQDINTIDTCNLETCACEHIFLPFCGDGILDLGEECDLGANNGVECVPGYGENCSYCSESCENITLTDGFCGDGIIDQGYEECDDNGANGIPCVPGYNGNCTYCLANCTPKTLFGGFCGNGVVEGGEECDDGNNDPGDGCSPTCETEEECYDVYLWLDYAHLDNWCGSYGEDVTFEANFSDNVYAQQGSCSDSIPNYIYMYWYEVEMFNLEEVTAFIEHREFFVEVWLEYYNGSEWLEICDLPESEGDELDSCDFDLNTDLDYIALRLAILRLQCHENLDQAYILATYCDYIEGGEPEPEEPPKPPEPPVIKKSSGGGGGGGGLPSTDASWLCGNWSECVDNSQYQNCTHKFRSDTTMKKTQRCVPPEENDGEEQEEEGGEEFETSSTEELLLAGPRSGGESGFTGTIKSFAFEMDGEDEEEEIGDKGDIAGMLAGVAEDSGKKGSPLAPFGINWYAVFVLMLIVICLPILFHFVGKK